MEYDWGDFLGVVSKPCQADRSGTAPTINCQHGHQAQELVIGYEVSKRNRVWLCEYMVNMGFQQDGNFNEQSNSVDEKLILGDCFVASLWVWFTFKLSKLILTVLSENQVCLPIIDALYIL